MTFLSIAGLPVEVVDVQEMAPALVGERVPAFAGNLRSTVRDELRSWSVTTVPLDEAAATQLRSFSSKSTIVSVFGDMLGTPLSCQMRVVGVRYVNQYPNALRELDLLIEEVGTGVTPVPDPARSVATIPTVVVGDPRTINVIVYDSFGLPMVVGGEAVAIVITGPNAGTPAVFDHDNGNYTADDLPIVVGTDTIAITVNGIPIGGSPFPALVNNIGVVAVDHVKVTPTSLSLQTSGAAAVLTADPEDASNNNLTGRTVTAVSSDTGKATVSVSGYAVTVTPGASAGTANITITCETKTVVVPVTVTTTLVPVHHVNASPSSLTIQVGGSPAVITADPEDASNNNLVGRVVTAVSSDTSKATVSVLNYQVTVTPGASTGAVNITITCETKTVIVPVTVAAAAAVDHVNASPSSLSLQVSGGGGIITADPQDAGNNHLLGRTVTAVSSDTGKATVSVSGYAVTVLPVATGSANITITCNTKTVIVPVTVAAAGSTPETPGSTLISLNRFNTIPLTANGVPDPNCDYWADFKKNGNLSIVSDPTAPVSPPLVLRIPWSPSLKGGTGPINCGRLSGPNGVGFVKWPEIFVEYWMKILPGWTPISTDGTVVGTKFCEVYNATKNTPNQSHTYFNLWGGASGSIACNPTSSASGGLADEINSLHIVQNWGWAGHINEWHKIAWKIRMNTLNNADGFVRCWIDGTEHPISAGTGTNLYPALAMKWVVDGVNGMLNGWDQMNMVGTFGGTGPTNHPSVNEAVLLERFYWSGHS